MVSMSLLLLSIPVAHADGLPQIVIQPTHIDVTSVDESFSIEVWLNVSQANVTNLKGWEIKIGYNTTILNCTSASLMPGHPLEGLGISSGPSIEDESGYAMYYVLTMAMDDYVNVTETKPLCRFNFTSTDFGNSPLEFLGVGETFGTYILDNTGLKIDFEPVPSDVTVIPEFSAFMLLMFMIIITAVLALTTKRWIKLPIR